MTLADLSIIVLLLLFAATALRGFNLGLGAFAAAFVLGSVDGLPVDDITGFFPSDFFVLIVGVTALFSVAHINGTLDWMLAGLLRLVRGNVVLVALVPGVAGALIAAFGTLPAAATAIIAPIAMGIAARYGLPALMMAVVGIMGILSGILSPLALYGVTAKQQAEELGLGLSAQGPLWLFLGSLLAGVLVGVGALVVTRSRGLLPTSASIRAVEHHGTDAPASAADTPAVMPSAWVLTVTLAGIAAVVTLSIGVDMNIGYLGMTAACLQLLVLRMEPAPVVTRMPWSVVLLIGGLLTYIGLMQELGAFERISDLLTVEGSAMLTLLVLCYIAGITSFAASSIAVFVTTMPLLPSVVEAGVSPVGAILAVAVSSVVVDINPLGITGGLILGSTPEEKRSALFRQLLVYGIVSVIIGPAIAWALFGWW